MDARNKIEWEITNKQRGLKHKLVVALPAAEYDGDEASEEATSPLAAWLCISARKTNGGVPQWQAEGWFDSFDDLHRWTVKNVAGAASLSKVKTASF
jgi:hypothetical protein